MVVATDVTYPLSEVPPWFGHHYVRIQSDKFVGYALTVTKITDKGNAYSVTASANQLKRGEGGSLSSRLLFELPKRLLSRRCLYVLLKALVEYKKQTRLETSH